MKTSHGYLLLGLGFLGGAYITMLDKDVVDWQAFGLFIAIGILGLWIAKKASHSDASASHVLEADKAILFQSINNILANLDTLKDDHGDYPTYELRHVIDKRFRVDLAKFADARKSMVHLYSTQCYADVMSAFAAGERYLNRVWSASADGYVDEVRDYVEKAHDQFVVTKKKLDAVDAKHS